MRWCTMAHICYETPPEKDSEPCKSIVLLILLAHDLNDSKLVYFKCSEIIPNDFSSQ